jgi:serine/threonine-protein kinase
MGAVYLVRHRLLGELRVIKVMRPQLEHDAEFRERFVREAKTAIQLRHPHIAQIYDFSVDAEGNGFIVLEYIDGVTDIATRRPGSPAGAGDLHRALRALSFLHRRDSHRDIAPTNSCSARSGGEPLVKLIDLGIAGRCRPRGD